MKLIYFIGILLFHLNAFSDPPRGKHFDRIVFVVFENANYDDTLKQPFFQHIANKGALLTNFYALTRPSQGNYIALTSGDLHDVKKNIPYDIDAKNIVDLLEAKNTLGTFASTILLSAI
ncbi:MAG: hypothetical protein J7501_15085 [Bdellovibrio sp.]|nr:hypothetical protein [Bdellovibrio sp.]